MGIVEYLRFVAEVRGIPSSEQQRRIDDVVMRVALGPMIQKNIGQLSKGFRQRVGLAATLIHEPEVLILDEPTSGLDPNQIIEIRELIREIGREKTVILSTHILPEVEATCSRVLIINEGRIVASGTPEELTRAAAGEVRCRVSVRATPAEIEPSLRALDGVIGLRSLEPVKERTFRYEVRALNNGEIEDAIFGLAVSRNWALTELHTETRSLEQVFTQLTLGERPSLDASEAAESQPTNEVVV
jgi:ABC-2 type transport system ATP-binding protein